jgi:hypothetical protein
LDTSIDDGGLATRKLLCRFYAAGQCYSTLPDRDAIRGMLGAIAQLKSGVSASGFGLGMREHCNRSVKFQEHFAIQYDGTQRTLD